MTPKWRTWGFNTEIIPYTALCATYTLSIEAISWVGGS